MIFNGNNKNDLYEKIDVSDERKQNLIDLCMEKHEHSSSQLDNELSLRRTENMKRKEYSNILNKVAVAFLSIGLSGAVIAGILNYNQNGNTINDNLAIKNTETTEILKITESTTELNAETESKVEDYNDGHWHYDEEGCWRYDEDGRREGTGRDGSVKWDVDFSFLLKKDNLINPKDIKVGDKVRLICFKSDKKQLLDYLHGKEKYYKGIKDALKVNYEVIDYFDVNVVSIESKGLKGEDVNITVRFLNDEEKIKTIGLAGMCEEPESSSSNFIICEDLSTKYNLAEEECDYMVKIPDSFKTQDNVKVGDNVNITYIDKEMDSDNKVVFKKLEVLEVEGDYITVKLNKDDYKKILFLKFLFGDEFTLTLY